MAKEKEKKRLRRMLRLASGIMLAAAIVFLAVALTHPELGTVFFIGGVAIGAQVWHIFYLIYAFATVSLFAASFIISTKKKGEKDEAHE